MICLVRLIVVERQTRMKGAGSRTHMMVSLSAALMMLVSAFYDREHILAAYEEAVRDEYRFFSFGDAMLML